jgi:hypothetical protein
MELPIADVVYRHKNPNTTSDLIIPIDIVCNTSDEQLISNITANSRLKKDWLRLEPEHNLTAILCGSGPSIADFIEEIKAKQKAGGVVFAMNGCAKYLFDHGIYPEYQVICDAREENVDLIGPAQEYLFASQVHPKLFEKVPEARLWHLQIGDIEEYFPDYPRSYALIGGAASVGNTATCLAYAMGYRKLDIYGYDSCHKNTESHAFRQPLNDGEPCLWTEFNGKKYLASFTMKHQAEKFQDTARALQQIGVEINVYGDGLLPDIWRTPKVEMTEEDKYTKMWDIKNYRSVSPGEECVSEFIENFKPHGFVIDFGCGTGRAGIKLKEAGCQVMLMDFTSNSRDEAAQLLPFIKQDLTKPIELGFKAEYGYCTDVMEHIEPENVDKVLTNIKNAAVYTFFQISTVPDRMGALIGQDLHLTVKPAEWWAETLEKVGFEILWQTKDAISCKFFVKA